MRIYSKFLAAVLVIAGFSLAPGAWEEPARSENGMVAAAEVNAVDVGVQILKQGGNAIDAAVAVGFTLAVTYPYAGNIGGGGFMVIHLEDGRNLTIDYREKAPLKAYKDMYLDEEGNFVPELSQEGVTAAGVPGSVAGLIYALENYGTMNLEEVIQPAIDLAENGFPLPRSTAGSFNYHKETFEKFPSTYDIFYKEGGFEEGDIFKQKDLANTLKAIKDNGLDGFYEGWVADSIVAQMERDTGYITLQDLEEYEAVEREPITFSYRDFEVISMPPPSSGGIAIAQMLNIIENVEFEGNEWGSSSYIHILTEAMKQTYADRSKHLGDMDYYDVPVDWLISKEYGRQNYEKITDSAAPADSIYPGEPFEINESTETTHYSVYDKWGNAVSVTTTINGAYGCKVVVDGAGFFLNNEMDDFSAKPNTPNMFGLLGSEANSIEPGKRMLSSMTPTIVLKEGKPVLIIGSPGGATIITTVLQVILNVIEFDMNVQTAIDMPRFHHQWRPDSIFTERFTMPLDVKNNLIEKGHHFIENVMLGRAQGIYIDRENGIIYGGSDNRGHGKAEGY